MKDEKDVQTTELPVGDLPKKRGRKPLNPVLGAKSTATRKREQRERQITAIYEREPTEWTDAQCLAALNSNAWQKGGDIQALAWTQLGKLRGFIS